MIETKSAAQLLKEEMKDRYGLDVGIELKFKTNDKKLTNKILKDFEAHPSCTQFSEEGISFTFGKEIRTVWIHPDEQEETEWTDSAEV